MVTYNILQPHLVEAVKSKTLDVRSGGLGKRGRLSLLDLGKRWLRNNSHGGAGHGGGGQKVQSDSLHLGLNTDVPGKMSGLRDLSRSSMKSTSSTRSRATTMRDIAWNRARFKSRYHGNEWMDVIGSSFKLYASANRPSRQSRLGTSSTWAERWSLFCTAVEGSNASALIPSLASMSPVDFLQSQR